jgi:hypothetical protein
MQTSALTVRFTPQMRAELEQVSNREHRPTANQVVHFVALGIKKYLEDNGLSFYSVGDTDCVLRERNAGSE